MTARARRALPVAAALLLAACGTSSPAASQSAVLGSGAPEPIVISAEAATCSTVVPGDTAIDCSVLVWYSNGTGSPQQIDLGRTRLVDSKGVVYRGVETDAPVVAPTVGPSARVSARWTISLPIDVRLASVTWLDDSGATITVPVATAGSPSPSPTATPTAAPSPKPTPKPAPKPTPKPTRTSRPSSGGPASGSIG